MSPQQAPLSPSPQTQTGTAAVPCAHCGQPVPLAPSSEPPHFCCDGCATVYRILHDAGLEDYYRVRASLGEADQPPQLSKGAWLEFDDPTFQRMHVRGLPGGRQEVTLYLEGVHCAACVWLVEHLPAAEPGCLQARLDFARSRAVLEWDPTRTRLSTLARFLANLGYRPHPWRTSTLSALRKGEDRQLWMRMGVAGAVSMNIMFLAIPLYAGEFYGMAPNLEQIFRWASFLIFLPSLLYSARTFFRGAWASLRSGILHMDLPLSIGILVGALASGWRTLEGQGDLYFDSLAMLIFLLLVSRWFQRRGQRAAGEVAELFHALTPSSARKVVEDTVEIVPLEALLPGMTVEVLSGESIPADGVVVAGQSAVDQSLLSGEPLPVPCAPGDQAYAGTVNLQAPLRIRLEATGEETRVGRLFQLMEQASARRAPIVLLADRLTGAFVLAIGLLTLFTALLWWRLDPSRAVQHTMALLIVTCPCALGMATPVAMAVAMGRAARRGILVKGGDALERVARASRIFLDKTGTLTEGRIKLLRWDGPLEARALLLSLEAASSHPLARATVEAFQDLPRIPLEAQEEVLGGGLKARWEGKQVLAGSPRFCQDQGIVLGDLARAGLEALLAEGLTPVLLGVDGQAVGMAAYGDALRHDTETAVARLQSMGLETGILSGDHPRVVQKVGAGLGLPEALVRGGLSPEQKLQAMEASVAQAPTIMVGDGVNDAAALSAATVGISVHGGAEASLAAADLFLTRPGLMPVVEAIAGSRDTLKVIRRNLLFSLGYNALGAALAISGHMSPLLAALLMPVSSLTVVASSLWRGGFRETPPDAQR